MTNDLKIGWRKWIWRVTLGLIPVSAIILGTLFFYDKLNARHLWSRAFIFLGLVSLNGEIWPALWRALCDYIDDDIKMIPHL